MAHQLGDLAERLGGKLVGDATLIVTGVASLDKAKSGDISLVAESKYVEHAAQSQASALLIARHLAPEDERAFDRPLIYVDNARLAFARLLEIFAPGSPIEPGIDPSARIHKTAVLGRHVTIQAGVYVGKDVVLADDVVLFPGVYIGEGCRIGAGTRIYPNVTLLRDVSVGDNCLIHPGAVIGSDGFGFVRVGNVQHKVPHVGTVIIEDDVEIGANVTIDRGTIDATVVRRGTKIDNLVQIGHNVGVGEDCLIVAMTGIAGSATIGDRCVLAGQSGVVGHVTVADDTVVSARGLVTKRMQKGSLLSGDPARDHRDTLKLQASLQRLPDSLGELRRLVRRVTELEEALEAVLQKQTPSSGNG